MRRRDLRHSERPGGEAELAERAVEAGFDVWWRRAATARGATWPTGS